MLNELCLLISPPDVREQIDWDKAEGVVILVKQPLGQENLLFMSTLTWSDLVMLSAQLDAHIKHNLGTMKEGF